MFVLACAVCRDQSKHCGMTLDLLYLSITDYVSLALVDCGLNWALLVSLLGLEAGVALSATLVGDL